jgi:TrmH family RNA methyltransferase
MTLDDLKKLHQKKYRSEFGLYLIEGEHLVQELEKAAVNNVALKTARLYVTERYRDWPTALEKTVISDKQMAQIADTKTPQGIIASVPIAAHITALTAKSAGEKSIYLFEVQDPGNLGTILRTLAWFGNFRCLLSPNSVDPFNPKVVRASMGALFHLPIEINVSMSGLEQRFSRMAYLDMHGESISSPRFPEFDCYCFGNEARGISSEIAAFNNAKAFTIPGSGAIESLNLASAVNMCAHQLSLSR